MARARSDLGMFVGRGLPKVTIQNPAYFFGVTAILNQFQAVHFPSLLKGVHGSSSLIRSWGKRPWMVRQIVRSSGASAGMSASISSSAASLAARPLIA